MKQIERFLVILHLARYWLLSLSIPICLFSFLVSVEISDAGENNKSFILATGSKTGVYYPIGRGIADVAKKANIDIDVVNSQGSVENLRWLEQGKAHLCLAQSDAVYYAYNGLGRFPEKISDIRVIMSLYTEAVHILIRNPLNIKKMEDFKGKRISVGPGGSGTESNAHALLEASGVTFNEFQLLNLTFDDAILAIKENRVDIVFITAGIPVEAVKRMTENNAAYIFEPKPDILQHLIEIYPFFVITNIPSRTYIGQDEEVTTVGVSALLVGRNDLDDKLVHDLTRSILVNTPQIAQYHKQGGNITLGSVLRGVPIPIFQGAKTFYEEKGLYRSEIYWKIANYLMGVLLILLITIMIIKFKKVKYFFKTKEIIRVFIFICVVWVSGSLVLYYVEHKINENYSNLISSLWASLVNLINFGQKEPFTTTGKTISVFMMVLGFGGAIWLTGEVASIIIHKKLTGGKKKMDKISDHFIIANWNNKGNGIVEQIRLSDKRPIIIIAEGKILPSFPEGHQYEPIYPIKGDPANEIFLRGANVCHAHSMIVLAKDEESKFADAHTILVILAARKVCMDEGGKQIPIIAEILDPEKVKLAGYAGIGGDGHVEIVSSQHLGQEILAQAAVTPGLTKLYHDLLTFDGGAEIYGCSVPSNFKDKTFDELLKWFFELRKKDVNIIPIALKRGEKIYLNPTGKEINVLEDKDYLYVISSGRAALEKIKDYE